jgi:hypothetical protein
MTAIHALALLATHATALAQAMVAAAPSPAARIALMVGAALVGAMVGLIPAVLLGSALGVVPWPTRARLAPGATARQEQPQAPAAPEPPPAADPRSESVAGPACAIASSTRPSTPGRSSSSLRCASGSAPSWRIARPARRVTLRPDRAAKRTLGNPPKGSSTR